MTDAQELENPTISDTGPRISLSRALDLMRLLKPDVLWDASFVQKIASSIDNPSVVSEGEGVRPRRKLGHLAGLLDLTPEEAFEPLEDDQLAAWEGRHTTEPEA